MSYEHITDRMLLDLGAFPNREVDLRAITRFSLYNTIYYRTNLWTHSRRVAWIVEKLIPLAKKVFGDTFNEEKAIAMALIHDDAETIFGDIQAGNKSKMTAEQLSEIKKLESDAIQELIKLSPTHFGKHNYGELLVEASTKPHIESIIVDWADKFDAFCESLHEVFAGNRLMVINVVNEYGTIPLPVDYYLNYFNNFAKKFPRAVELFEEESDIFKIPEHLASQDAVLDKEPHTLESLQQKTGYPPYDFWISLTFERGNDEDILNLYLKKE